MGRAMTTSHNEEHSVGVRLETWLLWCLLVAVLPMIPGDTLQSYRQSLAKLSNA